MTFKKRKKNCHSKTTNTSKTLPKLPQPAWFNLHGQKNNQILQMGKKLQRNNFPFHAVHISLYLKSLLVFFQISCSTNFVNAVILFGFFFSFSAFPTLILLSIKFPRHSLNVRCKYKKILADRFYTFISVNSKRLCMVICHKSKYFYVCLLCLVGNIISFNTWMKGMNWTFYLC